MHSLIEHVHMYLHVNRALKTTHGTVLTIPLNKIETCELQHKGHITTTLRWNIVHVNDQGRHYKCNKFQ